MFLKVIDNDKVKILVEPKDIGDTGITFENLDYNDPLSRAFILELLDETYIRTGINFLESKILIEAVPGISNSFYVIITRVSDSEDPSVNFDKTAKSDRDMYLFELLYPESVFDIMRVLNKKYAMKTDGSRLYKYRGKYYLCIWFPPETVANESFYQLVNSITEYSHKCKWRVTNEALLEEWGELIINDPAVKL